jgi:glutaredoxin
MHNPTTPNVRTWTKGIITSGQDPVIVFGVVPYRYIHTDSPAELDGFSPADIRQELRRRTGNGTVPQVFIGGAAIGGATELLTARNSGELVEKLDALGITHQPPEAPPSN